MFSPSVSLCLPLPGQSLLPSKFITIILAVLPFDSMVCFHFYPTFFYPANLIVLHLSQSKILHWPYIAQKIDLSFPPAFLNDFNSFLGSVVCHSDGCCFAGSRVQWRGISAITGLSHTTRGLHTLPAGFFQTDGPCTRGEAWLLFLMWCFRLLFISYLSFWFIWYRNNTLWVILGSSLAQISFCVCQFVCACACVCVGNHH